MVRSWELVDGALLGLIVDGPLLGLIVDGTLLGLIVDGPLLRGRWKPCVGSGC